MYLGRHFCSNTWDHFWYNIMSPYVWRSGVGLSGMGEPCLKCNLGLVVVCFSLRHVWSNLLCISKNQHVVRRSFPSKNITLCCAFVIVITGMLGNRSSLVTFCFGMVPIHCATAYVDLEGLKYTEASSVSSVLPSLHLPPIPNATSKTVATPHHFSASSNLW